MSEDNEVPAWTGDESPPIPGDGGADTQHSINNQYGPPVALYKIIANKLKTLGLIYYGIKGEI